MHQPWAVRRPVERVLLLSSEHHRPQQSRQVLKQDCVYFRFRFWNNFHFSQLAMAGNSLTQHSTTVASTMVVTTPKTILTSTNKLGTPVKTTTAITCAQGAQGAQRILLPAGSIGSLSGTNLMVVPAQYVSQGNSGASSSSSTTVQSISLSTSTSTNSSLMSPVVSSSGTSGARSVQQQQQQQQQQQKNVPVAATTASALSPENSKSQAVLESNGLKPRKPCNCTKSQCLKL